MLEPLSFAALFVTGLVAGALNVIAGGGSFLTLPVLIFVGLPPTVANGTNRVGILFQNVGAVAGFQRHRVMEWRRAALAAAPAAVGAVVGTLLALRIGDAAFQRVLSVLMVVVTLWTLLGSSRGDPAGPAGGPEPGAEEPPRILAMLGFFLVGVYGGFVQAGVGFFILAVTTWVGLDLVRGNALKVLCVLVFTILSLGIFAAQGKVVWPAGLGLAAGMLAGSQIGVRLTVLKGHRWVKAVVTVTVVLFAVRLWFT